MRSLRLMAVPPLASLVGFVGLLALISAGHNVIAPGAAWQLAGGTWLQAASAAQRPSDPADPSAASASLPQSDEQSRSDGFSDAEDELEDDHEDDDAQESAVDRSAYALASLADAACPQLSQQHPRSLDLQHGLERPPRG
ncbi:MAG TPA: hypothetical protein VF331_00170 [Polyangiales bacterium]